MTHLRPFLIAAPIFLAGWLVWIETLTFLQPPERPVAVMARGGLNEALAVVFAAQGLVVEVRGDTVIAISDAAGFVPRLYKNGALFVMLSRRTGCVAPVTARQPGFKASAPGTSRRRYL
jgi:hypothetical protein